MVELLLLLSVSECRLLCFVYYYQEVENVGQPTFLLVCTIRVHFQEYDQQMMKFCICCDAN